MATIESLLARKPVRNFPSQTFPRYVERVLGLASCNLLAELAQRDFSDLAVPIEQPYKDRVSVECFFGGFDDSSNFNAESMLEYKKFWADKWWPLACTPSFFEFTLFINFDRMPGSIWLSIAHLYADGMDEEGRAPGVYYLCDSLSSFFDLIRPVEQCPL